MKHVDRTLNGVHVNYYDDKMKSSPASQLKECTVGELVLGTDVIIKTILLASHKKTRLHDSTYTRDLK